MSICMPLLYTAINPRQPRNSPHFELASRQKCACGSATSSLTGECDDCHRKKRFQARSAIDSTTRQAKTATRQDEMRRQGCNFSHVQIRATNAAKDAASDEVKANAQPHLLLGNAPFAMTGDVASNRLKFPSAAQGYEDDSASKLGKLPGSPYAWVVQFLVPSSRSGIIRTSSGSVTEKFEVQVEWADSKFHGEGSYCAAECGEYHQFVKGYMRSSSYEDGRELQDVSGTLFGGKKLDLNVFHEDGASSNPNARYGHRNEKQTMAENYEPDRKSGSKYFGRDSPGVSIGTFADFNLTFVGKLVDTCNATETTTDSWQVAYRGIIRP